jgi:hypothetical protein
MGFLRGWCENLGGEREKKGREKKRSSMPNN